MGEAYLGYYVTYVPFHFVRFMRACDDALHHFLGYIQATFIQMTYKKAGSARLPKKLALKCDACNRF